MSEFPQLWNEYVKASTFDQLTPDQTKASVCEAIYQAVVDEKECYSLSSLRATLTAFNEDNNQATRGVGRDIWRRAKDVNLRNRRNHYMQG